MTTGRDRNNTEAVIAVPDAHIVFRPLPPEEGRRGESNVDLVLEGRHVSTCAIIPLDVRIGVATVRMDGIGGVSTLEDHRNRGYSRRVLNAAVARMAAGDAALTALYGIPDFYPRFGYTTAGPEYRITVPVRVPAPALPAGWSVRQVAAHDVAACRDLYDRESARATAAVVREAGGFPWTELERLALGAGVGECRVVLDPRGEVAGYAWHSPGFWFARSLMQQHPHNFVLAEATARDATGADVLLCACQQWAADEAVRRGRPVLNVVLSLPPDVPLAAAAVQGEATFEQRYSADGEFMARTLHVGRLLRQMAPELARRVHDARHSVDVTLRLETELGSATLYFSPSGLVVDDSPDTAPRGSRSALVARLSQQTLTRLALGAFPPDDLFARLDEPLEGAARELLIALFPPRYPHIYLADRF